MISKVSFRSFKSLREVDIDFSSRLTVLVGPNASGKTSVLQGISLTTKVMSHSELAVDVSSDLLCKLARSGPRIRVEVVQQSEGAAETIAVQSETLVRALGRPRQRFVLAWADKKLQKEGFLIPSLGDAAPIYRFHVDSLSQPAVPGSLAMDADGRGLAATLADIATSDPLRLAQIIDALRKVIPVVKQVRLLPVDVRRSVATTDPAGNPIQEEQVQRGYRLAFDLRGAERVPVEQVSEGTLLTLGWLTAVMAHEGRWLFLLDDIDRGLHPKAQRELVGILRSLLEQNPNYQIIATTHSPYLLDLLTPEEVRIVSAAEDGATLCGTLMEHPEFARWKDLMLPGEMWSTVGEEWLRDQRAKQDASAQ